MSTSRPKSYQDPATGRVTIREETPAEPIEVPLEGDARWVFAGYPIDPELLWKGEGERCSAWFRLQPIQCELIVHGTETPHYSQH
jgi:hypothetical protein